MLLCICLCHMQSQKRIPAASFCLFIFYCTPTKSEQLLLRCCLSQMTRHKRELNSSQAFVIAGFILCYHQPREVRLGVGSVLACCHPAAVVQVLSCCWLWLAVPGTDTLLGIGMGSRGNDFGSPLLDAPSVVLSQNYFYFLTWPRKQNYPKYLHNEKLLCVSFASSLSCLFVSIWLLPVLVLVYLVLSCSKNRISICVTEPGVRTRLLCNMSPKVKPSAPAALAS